MKMIPPIIDEASPSGEKSIFQFLKSKKLKNSENWTVFHSLNYPPDLKKTEKKHYTFFGESDFLIFIPGRGLVNIEVKGGAISRENGVWFTKNRQGKFEIKDPFKQAQNSLFKIGNYLKTKNIFIPQDFLVVFPDCEFDMDTIEFPTDNFLSGEIDPFIINKIIKIENEHLLETNGRFFLINEITKKIENIIRPNFEFHFNNKNLLTQSSSEINEYTTEQIKILDLHENKRMIITGSQGSGKTSMAEELVKRKLINGSVLFINAGRLRNEETKIRFEAYKNFKCLTFNNFLNSISNKLIKDLNFDNDYLKNEIHEDFHKKIEFKLKFISENILDVNYKKYDCIVLDEMQNYCTYNEFYGVLDYFLKDDLKDGSWYFFGDFNYQKLWNEKNENNIKDKYPQNYLKNVEFTPLSLNYNVRNASKIALHVPFLSGLFENNIPYIAYPRKVEGKVINYFEKNKVDKIKRLEKIIKDFFEQDINGSDIVILSPYKIDNLKNILRDTDLSKYYKVTDLTQLNIFSKKIIQSENSKNIYFSTIQGFQGMESKIVILLEPLSDNLILEKNNKMSNNLLIFNAMGRANIILYNIWDKDKESYVAEQLTKILKLN